MALVFRDIKGAPLTHDEVDGNFRHLTGSHEISGSIYVQGSISASGNLTGSNLQLTGTDSVLAASTLSASSWITASDLYLSGDANVAGNITGSNLLLTSAQSKLTVSEITASNLQLTGNADILGNITLGGSLTGGDANTDNITFNADITSDIRPNVDDTYDIGTAALRWQDIHAASVNNEVSVQNKITASATSTLADAQYGIWMGPFSISGTVDIGQDSNFVIAGFNNLNEIDLINYTDY